MPTFTNSWHSRHEPIWRTIVLPRLPDGRRRWIELGSFEGQSALWTLENALRDGDELVCCDIWPDAKVEKLFDENTRGTRIVKVKQDAFAFLLDQIGRGMSASCIYIDSDHHARSILEQAALSWRLLPVGGILIFDDYRWKHPSHKAGRPPPGLALDAFIKCYATDQSYCTLAPRLSSRKGHETMKTTRHSSHTDDEQRTINLFSAITTLRGA